MMFQFWISTTLLFFASGSELSQAERRAQRRQRYLDAAARAQLLAESRVTKTVPGSAGAIKSIDCPKGGRQCDIVCLVNTLDGQEREGLGTVPIRLYFASPSIVRVWAAIDGNFSDTGAAPDIVVGDTSSVPTSLSLSRNANGDSQITTFGEPGRTPGIKLVLRHSPSLLISFYAYDASAYRLVAQETAPLRWNSTSSWQTLARDLPGHARAKEYFFGGGMQNGRFSHRNHTIVIAKDYNWAEGGHPNPAPWYVSTRGYGVLRTTWAPGAYSFTDPVVTAHNESNRFDAWFMFAPTIKGLLGRYISIAGAPFLPPIYGMFLGDSDCYHNSRHGNSTMVATEVARRYNEHDMPHGWMLPNDGYGCGYGEGPDKFPSNISDLTRVVSALHEEGMYTGLWTSTGMPHIKAEVGVAGTRICKTDVGWIGAGYKYAFDGVELCSHGIEDNSDGRRFVWTVEGWAGTHRNAVMWTGDDSGSFEYIRWQLPTFVGCGFSAQAHVSGDVDGIFGGSPQTYVRDLQFKALTTTVMVMSGWARNPDKQPWTYGEPYTSINRASLKLKAKLTPYMYSMARVATDTGVPPVRALLLEFPDDESLFVNSTATAYQFMAGPHLLVAPVYSDATTRDGIYLPSAGDRAQGWFDWWNGTQYPPGAHIDHYDAPLDKIPIFVLAGAIVPLWPALNYFNQAPHDPITVEIWPAGKSSFSLYEDDGVTRQYLKSQFSFTDIAVDAPLEYLAAHPRNKSDARGNVSIKFSPRGSFTGQLKARGWRINSRCRHAPVDVIVNISGVHSALPQMNSVDELEFAPSGWYHDRVLQPGAGGLLMVKTPRVASKDSFEVIFSDGPSFPTITTAACDTPTHRQVQPQRFHFDEATGRIFVLPRDGPSPNSSSSCVSIGPGKDEGSGTLALTVQPCAAKSRAQQQFEVRAIPSKAGGAHVQIHQKAHAHTCVDLDYSDGNVEMYSCHDPSSAGNQAWSFSPGDMHVVSAGSGKCWAVQGAQG